MTATTPPTMPATTPTTNPNQALWEKGDFTKLAESMRESGEAFVAGLNVERGARVLDVGCGDGTTAIPLAQRGASVLGVDIARNLVEAGNRRAGEKGLDNVKFQHGDASALVDIADASVDLVVSVFGAMFAPRPHDVARELVRVTRPGGRIVMGNWIPGDPTLVAEILRISSAYSPAPPAGFISPMKWGVEAEVIERFGAAGIPESQITFERQTFTFRLPTPSVTMLERFRNFYGPTMNAFEAAERDGRTESLWTELSALFEAHNRGGSNATEIPATFLKVTVQKP
ncbi:MAG: class I SAM-dependent methyltransferase [Gemmatimonadota bacterium]